MISYTISPADDGGYVVYNETSGRARFSPATVAFAGALEDCLTYIRGKLQRENPE